MIVDAHVHLPTTRSGVSFQQKKEQLLHEMEINNIDQCIVISDSYNVSDIGSVDECVTLFEKTDTIHVVGGISPLYKYQEHLVKLRKYLEKHKIVGIKLFTGHEEFYLTDERLNQVYELAIQYNVPVLFHSGWDNSEYSNVLSVIKTAKKYPKLKLVCCHCFYPHLEQCMLAMDVQNVFFDISSIADDTRIIPTISDMLKRIIEKAPSRVILGSDYSGCSQRQHIELVKGLRLDKSIENDILWNNAVKLYQLY